MLACEDVVRRPGASRRPRRAPRRRRALRARRRSAEHRPSAAAVGRARRARGGTAVLLAALVAVAALSAGPLADGAHAAPAPKRIVTLTPFTSNAAVRLGVRPIAMGEASGKHIPLNRGLRGVRQLKMSHPNGPNIEQLIRLPPDLVLSSPN